MPPAGWLDPPATHTSRGWFELKYVRYSLEAKGWRWSSRREWGATWSLLRIQLERANWLEHETGLLRPMDRDLGYFEHPTSLTWSTAIS